MRAGGMALAVVALVGAAAPARALPVFARRYQTGCSTCHVQFSKLNAFGEAFRRNGYQYPAGRDTAALGGRPVTMVADPYRAAFPNSFWPSDLPESLPAAFILDGSMTIYPDPATRPVGAQALSFDALYARAAVEVAARIATDVAVFGGASVSSTGGAQLDRAFVVVSNLFFGPSLLNVRLGQFEPQIFGFSDYRKIGGPSYLLTSTSGASNDTLERSIAHSNWNATFVRAIDLSGTVGGRFGWNAAWAQGVEGSYSTAGISQVPRDGYGRAYLKLGGMRLDGLDAEQTGDPSREFALIVGGFFYGGEHNTQTGADAASVQNDVLYKTGGEIDAHLGRLELLVAAAYEHHQFALLGPEARAQGLAEATLLVFPWLSVVVRGEAELVGNDIASRLTPLVVVHPRINWKVQLWAQLEAEHGRPFGLKDLVLSTRYAF